MRTARTATGTPPAVTPSYACAHRMAQMHDRTVVTLLRPRTSRKPHGIVCCGGALATLLFELVVATVPQILLYAMSGWRSFAGRI